ncbi:non-ribosomal peptide synthetase, partial [Roseateles sp. DB2]
MQLGQERELLQGWHRMLQGGSAQTQASAQGVLYQLIRLDRRMELNEIRHVLDGVRDCAIPRREDVGGSEVTAWELIEVNGCGDEAQALEQARQRCRASAEGEGGDRVAAVYACASSNRKWLLLIQRSSSADFQELRSLVGRLNGLFLGDAAPAQKSGVDLDGKFALVEEGLFLPGLHPQGSIRVRRAAVHISRLPASICTRMQAFEQEHGCSRAVLLRGALGLLLSAQWQRSGAMLGALELDGEGQGRRVCSSVIRLPELVNLPFLDWLREPSSVLEGETPHGAAAGTAVAAALPFMFGFMSIEESVDEPLHWMPLECMQELGLAALETGSGMDLRWEFASDLWDHRVIVALSGKLEALLGELLSRPRESLKCLALIAGVSDCAHAGAGLAAPEEAQAFASELALSREEAYWRAQLADAPPRLNLPTDQGRPVGHVCTRELVPVRIDAALADEVRTLSQRHDATPFMTVLAAWALVLWRLSGQDDLLVGVPSRSMGAQDGAPLDDGAPNTLALRVRLAGELSVAQLLRQVRETVLAARAHRQLPFGRVLEIIKPPLRLDHAPLCQVMLAWHGEGTELPLLREDHGDGMPGVPASPVLGLNLFDTGDGSMAGALTFASTLFDAETAERYREYLVAALRGLVADEGQAVAQVALLGEAERRCQLIDWNRTDMPYPADQVLPALFEEQVARSPDSVALVFGSQQLSYAQLNARANQIAHFLHETGVRPDAVVGLFMERSVEMVAGLLGILKAGGAYLPIDPAYPRERISQMLQDSGISLLLSQSRVALNLPDFEGEVILLDAGVRASDGAKVLANQPGYELPRDRVGLQPHHLAYVIYTSGSTGRPKGVMVEQRGVVRLVRNPDYCPSGPHTVMLQHSSISFDVGSQEVLGPLLNGGRLVLHEGESRDVAQLLDHVERHQVNMMCLSAGFLPAFVQEAAHRDLPLECLCVGGEAFSARDVLALYERHPGLTVVNGYGPTENSIASTCYVIPRDIAPDAPIPIGQPIANSTAYVVDGRMCLLPRGAVGELCVGGPGVARGYLNRPELTAERFLADPFSPAAGGRMYRTGDLVRYLPDGNLEFLGRNDHQVKIRGFRIEPGEIQSRLAEHPEVREAAVIVREDKPGDKRLVAYVVMQPGQGAAQEPGELAAQLRTYLARQLPEYMVPAAYVSLEAMPLNANGKLDRKALPVPQGEAYKRQRYEAPQGELEEILAQHWGELLGLEQVGRHDSFFELGGHSLLAVRLISRLRAALGIELTLASVFNHPTLAGCAAALGELGELGQQPQQAQGPA